LNTSKLSHLKSGVYHDDKNSTSDDKHGNNELTVEKWQVVEKDLSWKLQVMIKKMVINQS